MDPIELSPKDTTKYPTEPAEKSPKDKTKYPKKPSEKSPKSKVKVVKSPKTKSKPFKTTRTTLGKLHLLVEKEVWQDDADIPQYAVEKGKDVTDHVEDRANVLTITGVIFGDKKHTVAEKVKAIRKYKNEGKRLTYVGRRTGSNFLINKFTYESEAKVGNGHKFTIILQEVRIAGDEKKSSKKGAKGKSNGGTKQTSGSKSGATTHKVKGGDTYWDLAKKYGTTWEELYKLNKYPPRKIPIGVTLKLP